MKIWIVGAILFLGGIGQADEKTAPLDVPLRNIPRNHWSVAALQKLVKVGVIEDSAPNSIGQPVTNYDLARSTLDALTIFDKEHRPEISIDYVGLADILSALSFEYRDEMASILDKASLSNGGFETEAYRLDTIRHHSFSARDWYGYYFSAKRRKHIYDLELETAARLSIPPRPIILPPAIEEDYRVVLKEALEALKDTSNKQCLLTN